MKIKIQQFLGTNHSWAIVGQNIARSLIKSGHRVDLFSTDGDKYLPPDLKPFLKNYIDPEYDMQLSYTAFKNFPSYLSHGSKNRFGIWTYEFAGKNSLPPGFAKNYKECDQILPPSNFAKQVFMESGVPESHLTVVPHGINHDEILNCQPYQLKTKKKFKIFVNIAQVHRRKNLPGIFEMFGKAFNKKDDVCLVIKVNDKKPSQGFELNFQEIFFKNFKLKYKNHAEVEVIKEFVPNIYSLYKACDACFSASHSEAFGMTALEAQAIGLINIAPRYGGFLDFLDNDNSLLIEGKEFFVKPDMVYWSYQPGSKAFMPSADSGVERLRYAYQNHEQLKQKCKQFSTSVIDKYSWDKVSDQILQLVEV
jgi:glycosyltransferase involved in cell wall biosynthesis